MTAAVRFQALPPLSPDEYQALEQSIVAHGVMVPIIVDEFDVVIDGHHRQKIASERGLFCPKRTLRDLDDAAKRTMALSLNLDRRHLTREQRRALVAESIKADPQLSDREHGRRTGVDHKTAASVRDGLEATGEIPQSETRVSADGRERPSTQPPRSDAKPSVEICRDCDGFGCETCYPADVVDPTNSVDEPDDESAEEPQPEPVTTSRPERKRHPLPDSFWRATYDLKKRSEAVVRLAADDRFAKNKDQIADVNLSDLVRVRDALNGVIQQLEG